MVANGWCPVIVDSIRKRPCLLGYARTLKCPDSRSSERHRKCTRELCEVNTRDSSQDPPKHVSESCKCNNLMCPLEDVKRFLQDSKIPVVEYCPPPHGRLTVSKHNPSVSSNTPFVAISHVWGDGLRGTAEKGLPGCQIERLAKLSTWILRDCGRSGDGAFWIDTLCIPEIEDLRHRAIGLMGKTYEEAEAVLVIDSGIREISSLGPIEERLFHVLSSRWMQRLWTFQEAALAKKIYFEFSDAQLVSLDELLLGPFTETDLINPLLHLLLIDIYAALRGNSVSDVSHTARRQITSSESDTLLGYGYSFSDLVSDILCTRTASRQSDETLAVCGVLNLDGFELARISDTEERMATFLLRIKNLPSDIIFLTRMLRLNKPGFRWAPKSFMDSNGGLNPEHDAVCTSTGLEAEYDAVTLGVVIDGKKKKWYISHLHEGHESIYEIGVDELRVSCNTILLDKGFPAAEIGAGVWVDPELVDGGSGGDRILCEFRTILTVTQFSRPKKSDTVMPVEFVRRMRVKVV